jgi:hypothetical protein
MSFPPKNQFLSLKRGESCTDLDCLPDIMLSTVKNVDIKDKVPALSKLELLGRKTCGRIMNYKNRGSRI